jgi:signal transduction histidine kinase
VIVFRPLDSWRDRPVPFQIARAVLRDRSNLFQSFLQPLLLLVILVGSLGTNFGAGGLDSGLPGSVYRSFRASEFYPAVILLITILIAGQYATDLVVQLRGTDRALRPYSQYPSPLTAHLSTVAGIVLPVTGSVIVFLAASSLLPGVVWPWLNPSLWILLGGLILLSIMVGCALGLISGDRESSDLLLSLIVFGSALTAGAFYPYPDSARIWQIAPYSPFTHLLTRTLEILRRPDSAPDSAPGIVELVIWGSALGATAMTVWLLSESERGSIERIRPADSAYRGNGVAAWMMDRRPSLLGAAGIVLLPFGIWLAGPSDFTPVFAEASAGLMYPYGGLAMVLLFLLAAFLTAPLVDGSIALRRLVPFRMWFLLTRGATGSGVVVLSLLGATLLWKPPLSMLGHTAGALVLFFLWAMVALVAVAGAVRDGTAFWVVAAGGLLLVSFLGGSLWNPSRLGWVGRVASYALPNGLLLHHRSTMGAIVVIGQVAALIVLGHPGLSRRFRKGRGVPSGAPPRHIPSPAAASPPRLAPARGADAIADSILLSERKRVLDEVHDVLGHGITGALWQIRSAYGMTEDPDARAILERAMDGLERGLARVREYMRDSAPRRGSDWGRLHASVQHFSGCPVELKLRGDPAEFHPAAVARFATTIEELLTNALRYGDPASIRIDLIRTARFHRLEYRERGQGWGKTGPRLGYGLAAVRSLFTEIGGSFHLDDLPGAPGIQIIAIIPSVALPRLTGSAPEEVSDDESG